ncbi:MAG: exosortase A, partial [Alphaproteobacteria bacterium]
MTEFRVLRPVVPAILLGMVGLIWLFMPEESAAIHVWRTSTAYNHCFLIIPISCWLIFERRHLLAGSAAKPTALAIIPFILFLFAWFVANRLGVMEGRQLSALGVVQSFLFGVLGWRIYKRLSAGFLYLFFLVPFGGFLVPTLQAFTTSFTAFFLNLLDIPNYVSGFTIQIAAGTFQIAEACAGLRFLIAAIAFSVLYSLLFFRSPGRRLIFIVLSVVVPVIANGFRALGIVWLGAQLGSAQAAATDHIMYGYIFFSIVIGLM